MFNLNTDCQFEIFKYLHYQDLFNLENAIAGNAANNLLLLQQIHMWWDKMHKLNICDDYSVKNLPILLQKTLNLQEINIEYVIDFEKFIKLLIKYNHHHDNNCLEKITIAFDHLQMWKVTSSSSSKIVFLNKFVNLKHLTFKNVRRFFLLENGVSEFIKLHANQLISLKLLFTKFNFNFTFNTRFFEFKNLKHLRITEVYVKFGDYNNDDYDEGEKFKNLKTLDICIYNEDQLMFIVKYMHNLKNLTLTFINTFIVIEKFKKFNFKNFFSSLLDNNNNNIVLENLILHNFQHFINADLHLFLLEKKILNLKYSFTLELESLKKNEFVICNFYNVVELYVKHVESLTVSVEFFEYIFCFCSICQKKNEESVEEKKLKQSFSCMFKNIKNLIFFDNYETAHLGINLRQNCFTKFDDIFFYIFNKYLSKTLIYLDIEKKNYTWDVWQKSIFISNNKLKYLCIYNANEYDEENEKLDYVKKIKTIFLNLKKLKYCGFILVEKKKFKYWFDNYFNSNNYNNYCSSKLKFTCKVMISNSSRMIKNIYI